MTSLVGVEKGWRWLGVTALIFTLFLASLFMTAVDVYAQRLPRNETLYKAGLQWGPPSSFNPFGANVAWPINNELLIYETLFAYNLLTGELDPVLARSYEWVDDATLVVTLHDGTRWQDGAPLTASDVAYTVSLGDKYSVNFSPIWDHLTGVHVLDDRRVQFTLSENAHKGMVLNYLTTIRIVPEHIWVEIEAQEGGITQFANLNPVGSGPYRLLRFSPEQIVVERDDNYWGKGVYGTPAPRFIVHPIFRSNDAGNLALERAQVDLSQQFVPEVWKMWEDRGLPVSTWFDEAPYFIPASIPTLFINVHKGALANPLVRRALAYAIDYERIAETAMSRYSPPARSSMIIPVGVPEQAYFSEELVEEYGWRYDPAEAVRILEEELGATKGPDGIYVLPDGTRLGPFTVQCPFGWTDWMTALEIVAESARAVGIDVRTEFPEQPVWNDRLQTGNFDMILNTPAGGYTPAHPWLRFRDVLDIRGVPEMGSIAFRNWNRYENPRVAELLDQAAVATDEAELARIYQELDKIFMQDVPAIPLMYRPWEFFTYNETYWTNFPSADNPYTSPLHNHTGVRVYFNVRPAQ